MAKKFTIKLLKQSNGPVHLPGLSMMSSDGGDCPRSGCDGKLHKTRDGYLSCNECGYEEYDG